MSDSQAAARSFVDTLSLRAAQQSDQIAYRFLVTGDADGEIDQITFGELGRRARAVGGWLQERGFAGSRALLLYPPGLEFVRGYMGCLFGAVVAVPCPAPLSGQIRRALPRLRRLVADAGAEVVLTTGPILAALRAAADEVPELAALTWVATEEIPDDAHAAWRDPGLGPDSIAFLQYTSGSTSAPRGVMVSHGNLLDNQRVIAEALGHTSQRLAAHSGDLLVSWLPVFHDMGLIAGVLQPTYIGRTGTLMSALHFLQQPERWLTAVSTFRPHMSGGPNFSYELCVRRATPQLLERLDLSTWRVAFNGAEPVRAATLRRFAEAFAPAGFRSEAFYPCYGLAEATLMVSGGDVETAPAIGPAPAQNPVEPEAGPGTGRERELVSCGRPRMTVVIADPELGVPCADGEVGEIWVGGASVAAGYWNDPAKTDETFNARLADGRSGFLRTGDLGFLRDGELYISGRRKDLLIIDGRNHYPQDLELTAEMAHPAVRPGCVAAFSVGNQDGGTDGGGADGERPVLVAEVAAQADAETGTIETAIRRAVSEEHGLALRDVVLIQPGGIHKTSSGKIQRSATRKAYLEGTLALLDLPKDEPQPTSQPVPDDQTVSNSAVSNIAVLGDTALGDTVLDSTVFDNAVLDDTVLDNAVLENIVLDADVRAIEAWLVDAVARRAEIDPAQVKVDSSIADYGIGSRGLVEIVGELSDKLDRKLEPTVLYEYPTIAGAARAFGAEAAGQRDSASASKPDPAPTPTTESRPDPAPTLITVTATEPKSDPVSASTTESKLDLVSASIAEPKSDPVPAPTTGPKLGPAPALTTESKLGPVSVPTVELKSGPMAALTAESKSGPVSVPIAELKSDPMPAPTTEPIAIVAMACRFPGGADDPEALWRILAEGGDVVDSPPGRWNSEALLDPDPEAPGKAYTLQGGYLRDIDRFDAAFFGISPREAAAIDPQQRLLLETAWETLERAGIVPSRLKESATGVYVGLYDSDYLSAAGLEQLDGHVGTGSASSVASGRIAYTLGLVGPAVTIDTACSSSLVAVHLAAQALRGGECDLALAGGATLMVTPRAYVEFSRLRGLSASGRCRPFAADADGMVWAEGCGLLLLKRLSDARRDGDRVLAVIRGSAVNQDGRSQGLSAPNGLAQEQVVRSALAAAELLPQDVDYVEAHGTGTPIGDPVEARALARVFGGSRAAAGPLYLGSLKSNLGHTQAAAGVAGVIKTVLALQHEQLPASLHADTPTAQVDWDGAGLRVLNRPRPWPRGERVRRAGVSSFGISGTNAHLILEEAPARVAGGVGASSAASPSISTMPPVPSISTVPSNSGLPSADAAPALDGAPMLFPISARSLTALRGQADRLAQALEANPHLPLRPVAGTLARHRTHFEQRAVIDARDRAELLDGLHRLASSGTEPASTPTQGAPIAGKLAFVFPGQGAQWAGMCVDLLSRSAVFAEEFERCDASLRPHTGWSASAVLRGEPDAPDLQRVDVVQPVLFAVMVSLAALWRSYGVEPDAVVGHSQGEVAAAYVAGALTLDDAATVVALRSKAVSAVSGAGAMAVVERSAGQLEPRLAALNGRVSVAAVNSSRSTVLAGTAEAIDALVAQLEREEVFVRRLQVDYASHSVQVEPLREPILADLANVGHASSSAPVSSEPLSSVSSLSVPWYSTVLGGTVGGDLRPDAEYWYRNLREPVRYADTVERMIGDGFRYFVELSPHPSLVVATQTIAEDAQRAVAVISSLRRDEDGPACLVRSLGALHVAGRDVRWDLLVPDGWQADLPTYAFNGDRHWTEPTGSGAGSADPDLAAGARHPLLGVELASADASRWTFRKTWTVRTADWLRDHSVFGRVVLSGTTVLELCWAALDAAFPDRLFDVADLLLIAPLVLPESEAVEVQIEVVAGESEIGEVSVYSRVRGAGRSDWTLHATAVGAEPRPVYDEPVPPTADDGAPIWDESRYSRLAEAGLGYGPAFRGVRSAVAIDESTVLAWLSLPEQATDSSFTQRVHPALLDAALHVASTFDTSGRTLLPVAVGRSSLPPPTLAAELTAVVRRTSDSGDDLTVDVTLRTADGFPAGELSGVRLRAATSADLAHGARAGRDLYELAWVPVAQSAAEPGGPWALVTTDADPLIDALIQALKAVGVRAVAVDADEALPADADTVLRFWPSAETADAGADTGAVVGTEPDTAHRAHGFVAAGLSELQALLANGGEHAPSRLVWVTRGAVATGAGDVVTGLDQSALWGLARSARTEHPDLGPKSIDLDPAMPGSPAMSESALPVAVAALIAAVCEVGEPELAIRRGTLLAPRLVRGTVAGQPDQAPMTADELVANESVADGTVLITGGLGAVGGQIARRLAAHGDRRFVLTSRRGELDPRDRELVAQLAALGAETEVVACDVTDAQALGALLARIAERGPLRGVVHAAGVLADGAVTEQTPDSLARVLRPKAAGAWNLHRLTLGTPLDFFVLLSSAAGVIGTAGQSNYAAANAFLDQLAHRRRAQGLPATSIAYGAWSGDGLADVHADLGRMADLGFRALEPEHALDLFELAIRRPAAHLVAWSVDLERLRGSFSRGTGTPALWRALLPPVREASTGSDLADRLARLTDAERSARVLAIVGDEVAHALGLRSAAEVRPDRPLREVGMDSVSALEVRNRIGARIGARLPATLLFDHPTTGRLAEHLLDTVLRRTAEAVPQRSATTLARTSASVRSADEPAADEPIAIVSMACRFPGGVADPEQFWRLLADGRDAIGPFPADRWDVEALYDPDPEAPGKSYAREGGFLGGIDAFDARFFGITAREAAAMDPQQRLLLETAWEALERAGIVPSRLAGSMTGVYIGMFGSEYASGSSLEQLDGYYGTGTSLSVASGRLAYTLGLVGPAVTVDTACSSSLLAVHMAAAALRSGECDTALAGGATLMVTPQTFVEFSRMRGLSPSGRCRSFSDDADGTGLSEGVGMVLLKRLSDARRDGDEVLAVLRGSAVNQDGRSQGLSVPNGPSQERVIRLALERSGLAPADLDYVEAHGTGTTLGDPIEANALAQVFGPGRPADRPLYLGSAKSNLGHLQAAAGMAGLMKVVLSLRHRRLPATLHAGTPSRHVDWDDSGLRLVSESMPWLPGVRPRRAGVSAFGISGTNVHVVVEEVPQPQPRAQPEPQPQRAQPNGTANAETGGAKRLFTLSARSDAALRRQAARLAGHLDEHPDAPLSDVAYTLARRRGHFERRAAVIAADHSTLISSLADFSGRDGSANDRVNSALVLSAASREPVDGKVAFIFPGHSPRWTGMALDLLAGDPAFAGAFARCDEAIARYAGWSVLAVLRGDEGAPDAERADVTQPLLFAVDCALAAMWRSLGVEPDAVIGHSLGEIAAAHVAGMLTLDQAAALVVKRGQAVREVAGLGGSLAVELPVEQVEARIAQFGDRLSVAAINGDQATTVSGDLDALADLLARLEAERIAVRRVPVDFATHSTHMERLRHSFTSAIIDISGEPGTLPLYSTVTTEPIPGDALDAGYWYRNLREPVRFAAAVRRMVDDGYRYFVEVGPHPTLVSKVKSIGTQSDIRVTAVGSLRRDEDGDNSMLRNFAQLYSAGLDPDWSKQFPEGTLLDLPTYAFEPDRHWSTPARAASTGPDTAPFAQLHVEASDEPDRHLVQAEIDLGDSRFAYLADHRVAGAVWLPAAAFVEMALEASVLLKIRSEPAGAVRLAELRFERALQLRADEPVRLQLIARPPAVDGTRAFTIASRPSADSRAPWTQHVRGLIVPETIEEAGAVEPAEPLATLRERCADPVEISGLYAALAVAGIEYRDAFQGLESGWRGPREAIGRLAEAPRSSHLLHPALLDAAFQSVALPADAPSDKAFVPVAAGRIRFTGLRTRPVWATSRVRSLSAESAALDVQLLDEEERVVLDVEGFELSALSAADESLYEVRWRPRPASAPASSPARFAGAQRGRWLILADESGVGAQIGDRLAAQSAGYVLARCGFGGEGFEGFAAEGPGRYRIDPQNPDHYARLFDEAFEDGPPQRVIHLFGLDAPALGSAGSESESGLAQAADRAALLCCTSTLRLVAALADRSWRPSPRLFLVTRGSQAADGSAHVAHPEQALLWGFGGSVAQEHPELRATLIDLPAHGGLDALWNELLNADDERQVALRASGRLVPRLAPTRPDDGAARIHAERTYLVTGGLGGLGRVVVERLAGLGARHVAVLGRSEPDADATEWISMLAQRGAMVHVVRADVADRASLEAALEALRLRAPAIAGIVHAAGVLGDATLLNLTPERIARVLAPKVLGAALLTELVPDTDFLVLFSSAAGLLGSAGQSSYAAANAFLDAWAHHLGSCGRSALSLDWGAWSQVGMVTGSDVRAAVIARSGLGSFSPQEGGELFERVLGSARRQLAPLALDRAALRGHPELAAGRPLLADLITGPSEQRPANVTGSRELVARMRTSGAGERQELLETYLRGLLSRVTGDDMAHVAATTPLKELDLDSLLLVTLYGTIARELGVELSASAATSAADIRGLATTILAGLPDAAADETPAHMTAVPAETAEASIPEVELRPATRDVMRLLRTEQQGTPSTAHNIGFAVRLLTATTRERLTRMLTELADRHGALRTGIVADAEHGQQLQTLRRPSGELMRWSAVGDDVDVDQRLRELMEQPFDLAAPPLWRFEMLEYPSGEQVLLYGAHHAVSDAQSLVLVMAEISAGLSGARLDATATNRDVDRLLAAQPTQQADSSGPAEPAWRDDFTGVERLDLTLTRPRPATRTYRSGTRFVDMPEGLLERVTARANRLAITPAAFCLGTLTVFLARLRGRSRFALAVPVDTRMHVGALDAVGFFGVPVPFAAEVAADEPIADVLRRTDTRLARVLEKGASFFDAMSALVEEGLYRPDAPLVEVYFNFIRPQALKVRG
ncbi:MAG TPA: SDR family NAD(P)-dependent oxidoreductase, partial [Actinocrinis sp.]|uniref:SDR family NAD(P)-dependent oxidoreductase n=1 Tax=Actinocrinis sp. TaxID=1920516 RepID=UPI002DDC9478